jgi:hypothetical protein
MPVPARPCLRMPRDQGLRHGAHGLLCLGLGRSIPEIIEAQGQVGQRLLDQRHGGLQVVALGAGDAHGVALNGALDLEFAFFDGFLNFLAVFGGDAVAHGEDLLDFVTTDFLDLAGVEEAHVHTAFGQLVAHHIHDLFELEVGVAVQDDFFVFELYSGAGAFEVKAGANFARCLVDGVAHFNQVGFENGIKRGHIAVFT